MPTYHGKGPVRGSCGHRHRTVATAARCNADDQRGCERQGGYSDRTVQRTDGEPLTEQEHDEALTAFEQAYNR